MWEDIFEQLTGEQIAKLREEFIGGLELASNKAYAKKHFRYILLEKCKYLPYQTVFFNELSKMFDHFSQLNELQSLSKTMEHLSIVRQKSNYVYEQTLIILLQINVAHKGDLYLYFDLLPICYQEQISKEYKTLEELHELEKQVCDYSDEKILDLLAIYKSTKILNLEFFEDGLESTNSNEDLELVVKENPPKNPVLKRSGLTRLQQVLVFQYLCKLANIDRSNCNVTELTYVFLELLGIKTTNLIGSEPYKKMLNPYNFCSKDSMIKNLMVVRLLLERLNNPKVLQFIDRDIEKLQSEKS